MQNNFINEKPLGYQQITSLSGVQSITSVLSGVVPQNMWCRLRTVNNTGTPSYSYRAGQEVSL